jgi:hypothetical protein
MITETEIKSWKQLQIEIEKLVESLEEKSDNLLFRGQANSIWKLDTTMERELKTPVSLRRYYRFAHSAKDRLETLVEKSWDIVTPPEYDNWLNEKDTLSYSPFPGYDYLAYLRHHGFPSPFIDWTASPHIAEFFAFNGCSPSEQGFVSIYCYLEHAEIGKIRSSDQPAIYVLGPYVKVHKRHVLQQSQYTMCIELVDESNPIYSNHELVFNRNDKRQDRLWKFNVPSKEKNQALKSLNKMNINSYSLFGSEDSLVESISTNEIIKNAL